MIWLALQVLLLGLASAISPMIFAVSVLLASEKMDPKGKLTSFLLGGAVVAVFITLLAVGVWGGAITLPDSSQGQSKGVLVTALGALLILTGAYLLVFPKKSETGFALPDRATVIFGLGVFMYAANFKSLLLNIAALQSIFSSEAAPAFKLACIAAADGLLLLPTIFPLLVYTFAPRDTERFISPVRGFLDRNASVILAVVCLLFGAMMLFGK
ncbi:MAG: GAP family protein [Candidatus Bilamarchaeaceae archaeon]